MPLSLSRSSWRTLADTALTTDYIADSVDAFLTDFGSEIPMDENEPLHLGFTFS